MSSRGIETAARGAMRRSCRSAAAVALLAIAQLATAANVPQAREPTRIPREALGVALRTLASERGFQLVYVSGQVDHQGTRGASGELTVDEALTQLLRGTGFSYYEMSDGGIVIEPVASPSGPTALGSPAAAAAARPAPSPQNRNSSRAAPAPLGRVTIEAPKGPRARALRHQVDHFVTSVIVQPAGDALYRWSVPICPLVAGLPRAFGELILERISRAAADAHAPLAGSVCHPDLFVVAHDQVAQLVRKWWAHDPTTFNFNDRGIEAVRHFFRSGEPVRAWYNLSWKGSSGAGCMPATSAAVLGAGLPVTLDAQACANGVDTRLIRSSTGSNITSAIVVVDTSRMRGMTTQQLADFIALIGLADVRLPADSSPVPSILELFGRGAPPQGLTRWDRALLYSLYNTSEADILQLPELEITMARRLAP